MAVNPAAVNPPRAGAQGRIRGALCDLVHARRDRCLAAQARVWRDGAHWARPGASEVLRRPPRRRDRRGPGVGQRHGSFAVRGRPSRRLSGHESRRCGEGWSVLVATSASPPGVGIRRRVRRLAIPRHRSARRGSGLSVRLRAVALALAGNADPARRSRSGTPVALHNDRWLPGIAPEPPDGRAPLRGEAHRRPSRSGRSVAGVMRARRWGRRLSTAASVVGVPDRCSLDANRHGSPVPATRR